MSHAPSSLLLTVEDAISILRTPIMKTLSLVDESPDRWTLRAKEAYSRQKEEKRESAAFLCAVFPQYSLEERASMTEELFDGLFPWNKNMSGQQRKQADVFYNVHDAFYGLDAPSEIVSTLHRRLLPAVERYLNVPDVSEYPVIVYREVYAYRSFPTALLSEAFDGEIERIKSGKEQAREDNIFPSYERETFAAIVSHENCPQNIQAWAAKHAEKDIVQAVADNAGAADEYRVYAQLRLLSWTEEY